MFPTHPCLQVFQAVSQLLSSQPSLATQLPELGEALAAALPASVSVTLRQTHPVGSKRPASASSSWALTHLRNSFLVVKGPVAAGAAEAQVREG
jgi:hypothetical protein